ARSPSATSAPRRACWAESTPSSSATTSPRWAGPPNRTWNCSRIFRCRSRRSTPLCKPVGHVQRLHRGAGGRSDTARGPVGSRTPAVLCRMRPPDGGAGAAGRLGGEVLTARRQRLGRAGAVPAIRDGGPEPRAPAVLCRMRPPDGGAGAAGRLVGEVLTARRHRLGRSGAVPMIRDEGPETRSTAAPALTHRRAAAVVVAGLTGAGVLTGAVWAWLAPPARGVIALSRTGNRVRAYLGAEADNFFTAAFLMVG